MTMNKRLPIGLLGFFLGLSLLFTLTVFGEKQDGYLELIGVPANQIAGEYDTKTGIFTADLRHIEGAYVKITYDKMIITGRVLEWRTKDDYLLVQVDAVLDKEKMHLTGDQIEYFSEEERMVAIGNIKVVTDDAVILATRMNYFEEVDKAELFDDVVVTVDDGIFRGQHFVMYIDQEIMHFYGPFQGEIQRK